MVVTERALAAISDQTPFVIHIAIVAVTPFTCNDAPGTYNRMPHFLP
jgi:hypothetical protein